jgi:WhiB family redox-sensing transcriptional regulator
MDWRHRAICRFEDPELFFPVGTAGPALTRITEAKAVCARCPVRQQCLSWAMAVSLPYGIAGGLTDTERGSRRERSPRALHRPTRPARPVAPTPAENAAAGRTALRAGATPAQVAAEFEVSLRTAERWAQRARTEDAQMAGASR